MAVPTVAAVGTGAVDTVAFTPTPPTHQADDILLCAVASAPTGAITAPGDGWAEVTDSPQQSSTTTNGGERLTAFWKRAVDGATTGPLIDGFTNHGFAVIVAIRGCITTGNPWDVTAGAADGAGGTALSMPGDTTTVTECLVINIIALGNDDAISGWTNTDLANVAEQYNQGTGQGNDSQLGIASGEKATAGAFGPTTATAAGSVQSASLTIAFKPPAGGATEHDQAVPAVAVVVPTIAKAVSKSLAVTETTVATISTALQYDQALPATVTVVPTIADAVTFVKALAVTVTTVPAIARVASFFRTLAATVVAVPSMVRTTSKTLAATVLAVPAITDTVTSVQALAATVTASLSLSGISTFVKSLTATVEAAAALAVVRTFIAALDVQAAATATIGKAISKLMSVTVRASVSLSSPSIIVEVTKHLWRRLAIKIVR